MPAQLTDALLVFLRRWAWILACLPVWAPKVQAASEAVAAPLKTLRLAHDFASDAHTLRERRIPLMVLFSRADCPWCERARRQYLVPLANDPATADRVLIRQVDLDSSASLIDFNGKPTSHRQFGNTQQATLTPTLMFFGPDGRRVAEPIVGFLLADFYAAGIDRGIDEGIATLRRTTP